MAVQRPKIQVSITERDLGLGKLLRTADELAKKPYVKAGFTGERGAAMEKGSKKTVAYIMKSHEYGATIKLPSGKEFQIPERSFMRSTKAKNQDKYNNHLQQLAVQLLDGSSKMTVQRALGLIGQEYIADVKTTIKSQIPPPLKAATIARKNKRLIKKAKATVDALHGKLASKAVKETAKYGVAKQQRLSDHDKNRLNAAAEIIMTGGRSTPLINTGQAINSLSYKVEMDGITNQTKDEETV